MKLVDTAATEIVHISTCIASELCRQKTLFAVFYIVSEVAFIKIPLRKKRPICDKEKEALPFWKRPLFRILLKRHGGFHSFFPTVI